MAEKKAVEAVKPEVDEAVHETAKAPETLSQLLGRMTEKLLTALQGTIPAVQTTGDSGMPAGNENLVRRTAGGRPQGTGAGRT